MIEIDKDIQEKYDTSSLALVQRRRYIKKLAEIYGMDFFFLNERDDKNKLNSFLPFFVVRDRFVRKKIVSIPFDGAFGGPISLGGNTMGLNVWEYLVNNAKINNISAIEIRSRCANDEELHKMGFVEYANLIGSELELENVDKAWKKLTKGHKWSINKFNKKCYQLSMNSTYEDIKKFYHIMSKNMRAYGTPMYPFSYFKEMWKEYNEEGSVVLIKCMDGTTLIGGALVLFNGEVAIYKYCSVIPSYIKDCVYHGLLWYVINESIRRKCKILNLGTSFINDQGLIYFKSAFGASNYTVYSYLYQDKRTKYHTVDELRCKYSGIMKLWSHLPLFVTETISNLFWRNMC